MTNAFRQTLVASLALVTLGSATARADAFLNQEGEFWRVSKLVGVTIYGPGDKKVGDINDVLMNRDGKATYVVVGVGGFLGIGEKNVAIPFDKVSFSQEPKTSSAAPANNAAASTAPAGGTAMPRSTAYPDHGTITYTAEQLKAAPTFAYAK